MAHVLHYVFVLLFVFVTPSSVQESLALFVRSYVLLFVQNVSVVRTPESGLDLYVDVHIHTHPTLISLLD